MLAKLGEFDTVEAAAKYAAGNWSRWANFVWFGSDDIPNSADIMIGYVLGPQSTAVDRANARVIHKRLLPFMGMCDSADKHVDKFNADFWGESKALSGYMVRVYDGGFITPAFHSLFELAVAYSEYPVLDADIYADVSQEEVREVALLWLRDWCKEQVVTKVYEAGLDVEDLSPEAVATIATSCLRGVSNEQYEALPDLPEPGDGC